MELLRRIVLVAAFGAVVGLSAGCGDGDDEEEPAPQREESAEATLEAAEVIAGAGIVSITSDQPVDEAFGELVAALEANPDISVVAEVDHTANAESVGIDLPAIREVIFGNPALGSPLMEADPGAGLDLPQKVLVYDDRGTTRLAYNDPQYLTSRHDLTGAGAEASAEKIGAALGKLVGEGDPLSSAEVAPGAGMRELGTTASVEDAFARLVAALEANPDISVVAEVDHTANAESVGIDLPAIREVIFGNPALGSPLMEADPGTGLDLPQKILIFEREGETRIAYNEPAYVAARHGATVDPELLVKIETALEKLATGAAGEAEGG